MASLTGNSNSRNIVVSGGSRGIGRALVRYFLEAGHRVFIVDINEHELEHTTKTLHSQFHKDGKLDSAQCNLRDVRDLRKTVDTAAKFFNDRIDVLVNNASIASPYWRDGKTMVDPDTIGEWTAYLETNLTSAFAMSQACIPYMKGQETDNDTGARQIHRAGPCIIHIGSFRAHQSDANQEGYAASKAGLLGLMQAMSISLGPLGIRVNLIAPGRIKVEHESKEGDEKDMGFEEQVLEKDVDDHPVNRAGRPKDIADAALYLMDAGFVTGVEIPVDGGALRKKN